MERLTSSLKQLDTLRLIFIGLITILLGACSTTPKPQNISVEGIIKSSAYLNPDIKGNSRPVNLRVFYLKTAEEFEDASYKDLFRKPEEVLGDSILFLKSQQILPGQEIAILEEIPMGLKYIGVVAAYRDIEKAQWKDIQAVPESCFFCTGPGLWDPIAIILERLAVNIYTDID